MQQPRTDPVRQYLVASLSGRALACSAARAGLAAHVIDLFADADTRQFAASATALPQGLDSADLIDAAHAVDPEHELPVVYGGGFESCPDRLRALCEHRALCGNAPDVLDALRDPHRVSETLAALGIPQPESRFSAPDDAPGWLIKRAGSSGGVHVRDASTGRALQGEYYQRRLEGRTLSVTLLADGSTAQVIGYAEQWSNPNESAREDDGDGPAAYRFDGAVSLLAHDLPGALRAEIEDATTRLSAALGLRGLNALDVIVSGASWGTEWALIDINARPGFCFELHEAALAPGDSLFNQHCMAVQGRLPTAPHHAPGDRHAHAIVYATRVIELSSTPIEWPSWTTDRPCGAQRIEPGEPICTVHAWASTAADARRAVMVRHDAIMNNLTA